MIAHVPFRLSPGSQPLVVLEASVNGSTPMPFILDTGAGPVLLTPAAAARLELAAGVEEEGHGMGGAVPVMLTSVDSLRVGGIERRNLAVAVTPALDRIGDAIGVPVQGNLGHAFFGDMVLTVDYAAHTLTFAESEPGAAPDTTGIPFQLLHPDKPLIEVGVTINGEGPFAFVLDTGASRNVISPGLAHLVTGLQPVRDATGAGGRSAASRGEVASLAIGGHSREHQTIVVLDGLAALNAALGSEIQGVVGYNFLRHFRVTVDYLAQRLRLAPLA